MKKIIFTIVTKLCLLSTLQSQSTTTITNYSTLQSVYNYGGQYTSITTAPNGDIYACWVDSVSRSFKALKISGANRDSVIVRTNIQPNQFHVRPSIAIDKLGYIHIAGDMHTQAWVYYRSLQPNSILSGFEMLTPPGGNGITYVIFFKDKNDELYLTFRNRVRPNSLVGSRGGAVVRYDAVTRIFTLLGGTDHGYDKTLVWVNMGGAGTYNSTTGVTTASHYQQPGIQLYFDSTNRMHLACTLINAPTTGTSDVNTHVLYAYSDDGGNTFKKIDGTPISTLPMGPSNMTVVRYRPEQDISAVPRLGAFDRFTPVISFSSAGNGIEIVKWNGSSWVNLNPGGFTGIQTADKFCTRRNGEAFFMTSYNGRVYLTNNQGNSFTSVTVSNYPRLTDINIDQSYYQKFGSVRFVSSVDISRYVMNISTIPIPGAVALSADLLNWQGNITKDAILLSWQIAAKKDVTNFEIEKLVESSNAWQKIGSVSVNSDVANALQYLFKDISPTSSNFYRLKILSADGSYNYSKVIQLNFANIKATASIFPNPFIDNATLKLSNINGSYQIKLIDIAGRIILNTEGNFNLLNNALGNTFKNINKGFYFLNITGSDINTTLKLTKQ
jgi:hypothetical protein